MPRSPRVREMSTVLLAAGALLMPWAATAPASTVTSCGPPQLRAAMAAIPGSAGAGNIVYALSLTNRSITVCTIAGVPGLSLLDANGHALPTHVLPAKRGATYAVFSIAPGQSAVSHIRFSPDVAGVGG